MKKIFVILMGWLCCWGLSACAAVPPTTEGTKLPPTNTATSKPLTTPEPLATATANLQPNVTRGPWPTPRPSWTPHPRWTSSPTASMTPAPVSVEAFQKEIPHCGNDCSVKEWPGTETLSGALLYRKPDENGFFLADMADLTNPIHIYPDTAIYLTNISFSPDGKWLAFLNDRLAGDEIVLDVFSSQGEKISTRWSPQEMRAELQKSCGAYCNANNVFPHWADLSWVDNQLISLKFIFSYPGFESQTAYEVYRLFNPFTQEWVEPVWMSVSGQDMFPEYGYLSPNQENILYQYSDYYHSDYARLETKDGRQLLDEYDLTWSLYDVSWTADSTRVLFGHFSGSSRRLYISELDEEPVEIVSGGFPQEGNIWAVWSPDNHTLAVVFYGDTPTIYLYDADIDRYTYRYPLEGYVSGMVWSPDGKWLLFSVKVKPEGPNEIQIMNVETGQVYHFMDNAIPLGWSAEFPVPEKP